MPKPLSVVPVPWADACGTSTIDAPLSVEQAESLATRLKALADPTRLRLLSIILASESMQACTCDLTAPVGLSQPTVSHHLKKLASAGLVTATRQGTWTYYRAVPDALLGLAAVISPSRNGARAVCAIRDSNPEPAD